MPLGCFDETRSRKYSRFHGTTLSGEDMPPDVSAHAFDPFFLTKPRARHEERTTDRADHRPERGGLMRGSCVGHA
jgi:hypothetical protein